MSPRSIHSYFKATPPKRGILSTDGSNEASPAKKLKPSNLLEPECKGISSQTVVDVGARIEKQVRLTPALSPNIGHSWFAALEPEFRKPYFRGLSAFIQEERRTKTIFPPTKDVFTWASLGDINEIKVVIIGQDPYHGPGQAHGLSFSVPRGVHPPPSLLNIFKELSTDINGFKNPGHGDLTGWAKQGVLLLNAVLTVRQGTPNSHSNHGWETLTDAVIKWINKNLNNVVFLLWGAFAQVCSDHFHVQLLHSSFTFIRQKKAQFVSTEKHLVLKSVHPSPLSAARGYFGCKHFSKANEYLKENGKEVIDWKDLD